MKLDDEQEEIQGSDGCGKMWPQDRDAAWRASRDAVNRHSTFGARTERDYVRFGLWDRLDARLSDWIERVGVGRLIRWGVALLLVAILISSFFTLGAANAAKDFGF